MLEQLDILARGSAPVIRACEAALSEATDWILNVNRDRKIFPWPSQHRKARKEKERDEKDVAITRLEEVTGHLQSALDDFCVTRLEIIQPYKHLFDPTHPEDGGHRGKASLHVCMLYFDSLTWSADAFPKFVPELCRSVPCYRIRRGTPKVA